MFVRFGKIFVMVAFIATTGAHWAALQSVAWTTMLANNLCTRSLSESVARTFDGKYPCPICKAIAAAKKSEKKSEFTLQTQKLEFPPTKENPVLIAPSIFRLLPQVNFLCRISYSKTADAATAQFLRLIFVIWQGWRAAPTPDASGSAASLPKIPRIIFNFESAIARSRNFEI